MRKIGGEKLGIHTVLYFRLKFCRFSTLEGLQVSAKLSPKVQISWKKTLSSISGRNGPARTWQQRTHSAGRLSRLRWHMPTMPIRPQRRTGLAVRSLIRCRVWKKERTKKDFIWMERELSSRWFLHKKLSFPFDKCEIQGVKINRRFFTERRNRFLYIFRFFRLKCDIFHWPKNIEQFSKACTRLRTNWNGKIFDFSRLCRPKKTLLWFLSKKPESLYCSKNAANFGQDRKNQIFNFAALFSFRVREEWTLKEDLKPIASAPFRARRRERQNGRSRRARFAFSMFCLALKCGEKRPTRFFAIVFPPLFWGFSNLLTSPSHLQVQLARQEDRVRSDDRTQFFNQSQNIKTTRKCSGAPGIAGEDGKKGRTGPIVRRKSIWK